MRYQEILKEGKVTFYHGSKVQISEFTLDQLGNGTGTDQEGPGIYLTSSAEDAKVYGEFVHVVEVKLVKSRMMPDRRTVRPEFIRGLISKAPEKDDILMNWDENPSRAIIKAVNAVMDAYGPSDYRQAMEQVWYDYYHGYEREWLVRMRSVGWDGFIVNQHNGSQHLICFDPSILTIKEIITG